MGKQLGQIRHNETRIEKGSKPEYTDIRQRLSKSNRKHETFAKT